jgi:hypothetical protein
LELQGVVGEDGIITLVSPLAEGADRLVAMEILQIKQGRLLVPLPFPVMDYEKDFSTPESCREFYFLLAQACEIIDLSPQSDRNDAYVAVGHYVVDHTDVMLAIWDGKPARGRGGTGDVVAYCRQHNQALYWINNETPSVIVHENLEGYE